MLPASFLHRGSFQLQRCTTPLPTYLPPYLLHTKAGPRLPTSGDSSCFGSDPKLSKFFRSEALHRSLSVDPAGCFKEILFEQTRACHFIDWVGYFEILATVLFADLHGRTCFFPAQTPPRTRLLRHSRKLTQDDWKMCLYFQVQIKHIIWQTFFAWMSF